MRYLSIYEVRRQNLRVLVDTLFDGEQIAFAKAISMQQSSRVSRLLSLNPKTNKRIGNDLSRVIEKNLGLPDYWMDQAQVVHQLIAAINVFRADSESSNLDKAAVPTILPAEVLNRWCKKERRRA